METTTILTHTGSFILGSAITYTCFKFKAFKYNLDLINDRLTDVEDSIVSPEDMALQILKLKMPINKLPPELVEQIKVEAEELSKLRPPAPSYTG